MTRNLTELSRPIELLTPENREWRKISGYKEIFPGKRQREIEREKERERNKERNREIKREREREREIEREREK